MIIFSCHLTKGSTRPQKTADGEPWRWTDKINWLHSE
jgi:hypothetical protein